MSKKENKFHKGQSVNWNSESGHVSGTIKSIHTKPFKLYGKDGTAYTRHASKDNPVYEIKSNKTDHVAYHYGKALHKAQSGVQIKPPFEEYYKTIPQYKNDTSNYNLRAAYNNLPYPVMEEFANNPEAHLPDTYKLPNHPTFSNESIYFDPSINKDSAGYWKGNMYIPYNPKYRDTVIEKDNGGKIPVAKTKSQQYNGLNNSSSNKMLFPLEGNNVFRGLYNYQPVHLIDQQGNEATLIGPNDITTMKGNVMENKAKSGIKINPKNKGKFNATKKRTGKTTEELTHSKNPITKKRAIFAQNASHWRKGEDGLGIQPLEEKFQGAFPSIGDIQIPDYIDPNALSLGEPRDSLLSNISPIGAASVLGSAVDLSIPYPKYKPKNILPQEYEAHPYGTGSQAIYQTGGTLSDDEVYKSYLSQLKDKPDANRLATVLMLSNKYGVPTTNIFTTTDHAWDNTMPNQSGTPRRITYNIIKDGQPNMTFVQDIAGDAAGGAPLGTPTRKGIVPMEGAVASKTSGGGLSRKSDYGSKKKPYPEVPQGKFLGPHRSYPVENIHDAVDALRLAGMHHDHAVIAKVYKKYPSLKHKKAESGMEMENTSPIPLQFTYGNGGAKVLSDNPHSTSPTIQFVGPSHEEGGIGIQYGKNRAEVEGDETAFVDNSGDMNIMGNMKVPGMKKKFKNVMKDISLEEDKSNKYISLANKVEGKHLLDNSKFGNLATNSANLMKWGADMKLKKLNQKKENLVNMQNKMLDVANALKIDPQAMSYGKIKKAKSENHKAQAGKRLSPEELNNYMRKFGSAESSNNYFVPSPEGSAYGRYQFTKSTRDAIYKKHTGAFKAAGIDTLAKFEQSFKEDPQVQDQVMSLHLNHLYQKYNGNPQYIALAHRLGEGAADSLIKTGHYTLNGEEHGWDDPITASVTGNETPSDYVKKITGAVPNIAIGPEPTEPNLAINMPTPGEQYGTPEIPNVDLGITPVTPKVASNTPSTTPSSNSPSPQPFEAKPYEPTPLSLGEIAPELYALGANRLQGVQGQSYTPRLYQPYQISLQDQLNQNESTFRGIEQAVSNNPEALSTLAAKKYQADEGVLGNEFRANQQINNQITNENTQLLNRADLVNLKLGDTQYVRQEQARANTQAQNNVILNSIASKVQQNRLANKELAAYQNLYPYYRMEDTNDDSIPETLQYVGPKSNLKSGGKIKKLKNQPNSIVVKLLK